MILAYLLFAIVVIGAVATTAFVVQDFHQEGMARVRRNR